MSPLTKSASCLSGALSRCLRYSRRVFCRKRSVASSRKAAIVSLVPFKLCFLGLAARTCLASSRGAHRERSGYFPKVTRRRSLPNITMNDFDLAEHLTPNPGVLSSQYFFLPDVCSGSARRDTSVRRMAVLSLFRLSNLRSTSITYEVP